MMAIRGSRMWPKSTGRMDLCGATVASVAKPRFSAKWMAMRRSATWSWSVKARMSAGAALCAAMTSLEAG